MISFSISYIYKYYLEANPYIHRSPPVASTDWCIERTISAPTNAHQKRTYRCAPKAHLPLIYIFATAPVRSAPTGAHQKCTYRCAVGVHQKRTYPSFTYLHPHLSRAHLQVRTKSAPKVHLQVCTKSASAGAHQKRTYPSFTYCTRTKSTPTTVYMYEKFRWQRTKHAPIWAHLLCRCATHLKRTYILQGQAHSIHALWLPWLQACGREQSYSSHALSTDEQSLVDGSSVDNLLEPCSVNRRAVPGGRLQCRQSARAILCQQTSSPWWTAPV